MCKNIPKILRFIAILLMLSSISFSQANPLKGTVVIRKKKEIISKIVNGKRVFSNKENPLKGKWELSYYEINKKKVDLNSNTHELEFYDSTYRFKRIYEKPRSRVYEGTFPVYTLRRKINSAKDTLVKFKYLYVENYHMLYDADSLVVTDLVNVYFLNFKYSPSKISFEVEEKDKNMFIIRTLYFEYVRKED